MTTMQEQVQAISPERGYHITGLLYLGYGHNFEEVERGVNIELRGEDALLLSQAETEEDIAQMIANVYNELDIDDQDPHFLILRPDDWKIVIEQGTGND